MVNQDAAEDRTSDGCAPIAVLLVDDQPFVGAAIKMILATEPDIEIHCCYTADEAIGRATALAPALIFQDLVMPGTDGLTLVGLFRKNPITAGTPIVVLSGNDDAESRTRSMAAGADDYLVKLPKKPDLIACIRRHAAISRAA